MLLHERASGDGLSFLLRHCFSELAWFPSHFCAEDGPGSQISRAVSKLESFLWPRSNNTQTEGHLSIVIAASETPGTSTGIGVGFQCVGRRLPTLEPPQGPTEMAGENQGRCSAFKGRATRRTLN